MSARALSNSLGSFQSFPSGSLSSRSSSSSTLTSHSNSTYVSTKGTYLSFLNEIFKKMISHEQLKVDASGYDLEFLATFIAFEKNVEVIIEDQSLIVSNKPSTARKVGDWFKENNLLIVRDSIVNLEKGNRLIQGYYKLYINLIYNLIEVANKFGHIDRFSIYIRGLDLTAIKSILDRHYHNKELSISCDYYRTDFLKADQLLTVSLTQKTLNLASSKVDTKLILRNYASKLPIKKINGLKRVVLKGANNLSLKEVFLKHAHHFRDKPSLESIFNMAYMTSEDLAPIFMMLDILKSQLIEDFAINPNECGPVLRAFTCLTQQLINPAHFFTTLKSLGPQIEDVVVHLSGLSIIRERLHPTHKNFLNPAKLLPSSKNHEDALCTVLLPESGFCHWKMPLKNSSADLSSIRTNVVELTLRMLTGGVHYSKIKINGENFDFTWDKNLNDNANQIHFFTNFLKRFYEVSKLDYSLEFIQEEASEFVNFKPTEPKSLFTDNDRAKIDEQMISEFCDKDSQKRLTLMNLPRIWNLANIGTWSIAQAACTDRFPALFCFEAKYKVRTNKDNLTDYSITVENQNKFSVETRKIFDIAYKEKIYGQFTVCFKVENENGLVKQAFILIESFKWDEKKYDAKNEHKLLKLQHKIARTFYNVNSEEDIKIITEK